MELKDISQKRQKKWKETDLYKVREDTSKPKFYILDMFPYPSGSALHVGHPKGYIATDCLARKKMLEGFNVLHPMGFDTFGLWTEQYAIEHKMKPQVVSEQNIKKFINQLENFGTTYDRSRSVNTADPKYFKRTQRIFLQLYTHYYDEKEKKAKPIAELKLKIENWKLKINGNIDEYLNKQRLAYVDYKPINRCPSCMTWLANEDLDDGKCERCGSEVEQKPMKQRVLRITKYAERLIEGLDDLKREESMKDLERNWIGKSEWTEFKMKVITEEKDRAARMVIEKSIEPTAIQELLSFWETHIEATDWDRWNFYRILVNKKDEKKFIEFLSKHMKTKNEKWNLEYRYADSDWTTNIVVFSGGKMFDTSTEEWCKDAREYGISVGIPEYQVNFSPWKFSPWYKNHSNRFEVYTTRIDTVYGMSFVAIAPEHPLVDKITTKECKKEVETYKEKAKHKTQLERTELQKEKTGVFCGAYAINPFNNEKVPIFVADYVLANYGTWVVMAVPAHDERDFEFAKKYDLPIKYVIHPLIWNNREDSNNWHTTTFTTIELQPFWETDLDYQTSLETRLKSNDKPITTKFGRLIFSKEFTGKHVEEAISAMQERLEKKWIGGKKVNYKMQDRVFSRQRYRGEPFPILRVEDEPKFSIHFYEQKTWKAIVDGVKTIETRALNPEEPERYFGDVRVDDVIKFINKETKEELFAKVTKVYTWDNFDTLWNEDKHIIEKIYTNKKTFAWIKTIEAFKKWWDFQAGYVDKIEKNGLVGREFEIQKNSDIQNPKSKIQNSKAIPLSPSDLPVTLPDVENYEPTGTEEWPLANIDDWVNVTLPDGTKAKRETNTMPGRAGSSRYWLRYMDVDNDKAMVGKDKEAYRGSVDVYVGGAEHITRHMIYGRFWQKFLFDIGVISHDEPFQEYHSVGLIMGEDGRKMSKRRGNVVNPDNIISEFWTDVLRAYEMFMGPFDQSIARSTNGIKGIKKFLDKIVALKDKITPNPSLSKRGASSFAKGGAEWNEAEDLETKETLTLLNQTIKKVGEDINGFRFNTAISQLMILVNHLTECPTITKKTFEDLVLLVSPFAPHLAEELWEQLGNEYSIFTKATWPKYDEKCLVADTVNIGVQINGKVRWTICISKEAEENEVMQLAKADEKIAAWIVGEPKKVIYVKGKILNIVV